jgi:O-antigen/teichoic acid export membrane protein
MFTVVRNSLRALLSKFGPGSLSVIVVRVLTVAVTFLMALVLSRSLGVEDTGSFFLVYSIVNVAAAFGRFGTDNLVLRVSAEPAADLRRQLRNMVLVVMLASAVAFVVLGFTLTPLLDDGGAGQWIPGLGWIVASSIFPLALSVLCGSTLRGNGRMAAGTLAELGTVPAVVTVMQAIFWYLGVANLVTALLLLVGAAWAALAWSFPAMAATIRSRPRPATADTTGLVAYLKRNFARLGSMMGSALLIYAITWAPVLILGAVASVTEVGYFTVAQRVAVIVTFISTVQVSYMAPRIATLYTRKEIGNLNKYLRDGVRLATAVVFVPALVFVIFPGWTMRVLFGTPFEPGANVLVLLVIASIATVAGGQISSLMILCDMERALFALNAVAAVIWVTVGIWLSGETGAFGAALVTLGVTLITTATGAILLRRKMRIVSYLTVKGATT